MTSPTVLYEVQDGIARITLNRPEKRNALNGEIISGLREALASSARHAQCRVVLISGAGTDFCSGADLAGLDQSAQASVLDNMADARNMAEVTLFLDNRARAAPAAFNDIEIIGIPAIQNFLPSFRR